MLDPTLQETLFKRSVRKYFVDELETIRGQYLTFDTAYSIPVVNGTELNSWYGFHFGDINLDILSTCMLEIYCFSRKDTDGENLSTLRDTLMDVLFDDQATDGLKKIPYLNQAMQMITGIVPLVSHQSEEDKGADGTKFKLVTVKLRWGTK